MIMENYNFLVSVAIIIATTKMLGDITHRFNLTQVVGALFAGVIVGPSCLALITETNFIACSAEIGVIILMFMAGMDTDINEIKSNAKACIVTACIGVIVPLIGGTVAYMLYFDVDTTSYTEVLKAVFVGVLLTATSVSITVEALREMGKLEGKVGNAILGAAVLDDIIGIMVLTVVSSLKDPTVSISLVLIKIVAYAVCMVVLALLINFFKDRIDAHYKKQRISTYVLASCLLVSFASEHFFGVADITGAFLLGMFLSQRKIKSEVSDKLRVPSYMYFSPIFFASVGLKVELDGLTVSLLIFSLILLVVAIISKIIGCGLGAKLCGFTNKESIQVGVGMVARGEVALIVAQKGYAMGLLDPALFSPLVIVVITTTIITPILLKKIM